MRSVDLAGDVIDSARRRLPVDPRVALALSGGVDSVVLLHLLASLRPACPIDLHAFHIHHGLSANADAWEAFCRETCAALDVPFSSARIRVHPGRGGLEAAARRARYTALESLARESGAGVIALGHHADDQAETVALQLLRGAAPRGLAAMPEWRAAGQVSYWRPLLAATRADIAAHADRHGLRWIEDESNASVALKRNFLRARVMPSIESGFPDYRVTLSRAAARASEAAELLDQLAQLDARIAVADNAISVAALRSLGSLRATNLLRHVLRIRGLSIPRHERLVEFVRQAIEGGDDRHPALALDDLHALRIDRGQAAIVAAALPFSLAWREHEALALPHGQLSFERTTGAGIRAAQIPTAGLLVRPRAGGERLQLAVNRPHRTLKNLMQEAGIPASLRARWPLLADSRGIVAIPGIGVGVDWECPSGEQGWTVEWRPSGLGCRQ